MLKGFILVGILSLGQGEFVSDHDTFEECAQAGEDWLDETEAEVGTNFHALAVCMTREQYEEYLERHAS